MQGDLAADIFVYANVQAVRGSKSMRPGYRKA